MQSLDYRKGDARESRQAVRDSDERNGVGMKVGPLFKWFGSKWQSAKRYPKPLHDWLYEPFAGGAGYSLNYPEKKVVIYEENNLVRLLWCWIIGEATTTDVMDIPIDYPVGHDIKCTGLSYGQQLLLKHWQRTNNYGNCWTTSPWGNKPGQWTANTRSRVANEIHAVKHWQFRPIKFDEAGSYFIDPPYEFNYRYGFNNFDYKKLVSDIQTIPLGSQIIACEAACPKTGNIPNYLPFVPNHVSVTSRRKTEQNHHSKELLWECNR